MEAGDSTMLAEVDQRERALSFTSSTRDRLPIFTNAQRAVMYSAGAIFSSVVTHNRAKTLKATSTAASLSLPPLECFDAESTTGVRPVPLFETRRFPTCHPSPVHRFGQAVAVSDAMVAVLNVLERFAATNVSITLLGETGTGKDVLARAVHERSARAAGPLVVFDCGAVTAGLAESELFGHERGSFTGAVSAHAGAFERADGGTLFLDEIGELSLDLQPRLLRALESRSIRRVGGSRERSCDVRVVAATNRDLRAEVAAGRFREDLYFRLATAVVVVPPLRDRVQDLDVLVPLLLDELGGGHLRISEGARSVLRAQRWLGNVRELKNMLACALVFMDEQADSLESRHLRISTPAAVSSSDMDGVPLGGHPLTKIERAAIVQTLALHHGNRVHAARALGIAASTLYEKLKRHGI